MHPKKISAGWKYVLALIFFILVSLLLAEIEWRFFIPADISRYSSAGDYFFDADPALVVGMHGNIFNMYSVSPLPAMMPLALLARIPELLLGSLLTVHGLFGEVVHHHKTGLPVITTDLGKQRYLIGAMGLFALSGGVLAISYLPKLWSWRNYKKIVTAVLLIAVLIFNPLSRAALGIGHPEELLMASLIGAAVFSLYRERYYGVGICLAAAIATKQPAIFVVPAFFFALPISERYRTSKVFIATLAITILPFIVLHMEPVLKTNIGFANGSVDLSDHAFDLSTALGWTGLSSIERVLLLGISIGLPWFMHKKSRTENIPLKRFLYLVPLIMIFRCIFDPFNIGYYALPIVTTIMVLEVFLWERGSHPLNLLFKKSSMEWSLPIGTLAIAYYLYEFTGGPWYIKITQYISPNVAYLFYLFTILFLIGPLLMVCLSLKISMTRTRALAYTSIAALIFSVFVAVALVYKPPEGHGQIAPPAGYMAATPKSIAVKASPQKIYWLGNTTLPDNNFLRLSATPVINKTFKISELPLITQKYPIWSLFDYGQPNGSVSATIFTYKRISSKLIKGLKACHATSCKGWHSTKTPLGRGEIYRVNTFWEAIIPVGKELIYINDNGTGLSPAYILGRLQQVP